MTQFETDLEQAYRHITLPNGAVLIINFDDFGDCDSGYCGL